MANNSDGSIVLSVTIDTDTLKRETQKLNKDILQAVKSESKIAVETEKANQALLKTQILQEKLNSLKEKSRSEQEKENQALLKSQLLQEKIATQQEKTNREQIKSEQTLRAERAKADKELERQRQAEANRIAAEERSAEKKQIAEVKLQQEQLKAANLELKKKPEVPQPENAYQELQGTIEVQEQALQSLKEKYASLVLQKQQNSDEAKKLKENIKNLSGELDENRKKLENSKNAANVFDKSMSKVKNATNFAIAGLKKFAIALGIYLGLREIIRFSNEASKLASQQEANLKRLSMLYGENTKQVYDFVNANAAALGMSKTVAYQAAADYGNLFRTFSDGAESAKLTNDMLKATAVIASQTGRTYEDVFEKIRSGLYGNTRAIDDLGITVRKAGLMQTQAFQTVSGGVKKWNDLTDAELQNARALGIIEQTYKLYGNTVLQSTALTRSQFNAAWTDFKATWGQAVNLVLIPILTVATRILTTITAVMQKIFHLTGKQVDTSSKVSANIGGAAAAQDDLANNIGKANKGLKETNNELKKELASFDELEILSQNRADNAASGGTSGGGTGGGVSTDVGGSGGNLGNEGPIIDQGEIDAKLAAIAAIAGAALVGLGILVMFSGHPFLGLGMVAVGAVGVWSAVEMSKNLDLGVQKKLEKLFNIVGTTAFMLGCVLLFVPGCWKYGLGLMALGVSALGYSTFLGDGNKDELLLKISELLLIVGVTAFMLGVVLLFIPGCWGYGLGFMLKGAVAIGLSAALGGEQLKEALKTFCDNYWVILYEVGIIMVCVGVVLLFVAAAATWQIALTLILVGIADIVGTTALSWATIKQDLEEFCGKYWKAIYVASLLMLVVGIMLCFTTALPYGITLIVLGATAIGTTTAFGFTEIKEGLTTLAGNIQAWIEKYDLLLFILGIMLLFTPAFPVGLALMKQSGKTLFGEQELSFEYLKDKLVTQLENVYNAITAPIDKIKNKIKEITGSGGGTMMNSGSGSSGGGDGGGTRPQSLSTVLYKVPALARGAVIPANREFLAVLGDQKRGMNIEAPAELIKQMAMEAIVEANAASVQQPQTVREEHYYLDQTELMCVLYKLVKNGERLDGNSFVKRGGYAT